MSLPENVKDHLESNGVAYKHYSHDEEFLASRGADLVRLRREGLCQDRHGASG